ncbi:reticulophagy regulator 3-like isoform X1 [Histomonas meleagridis]|uniref:reticulophagy regulator 3-like isoform X1 n=1 Tax=Histomonas meleagridis TaxID=135588 RepID=UPI003559EF31|nr:reticulophagy regulator 3-like isoform X1 [Histomonas meleagridis]KAH0802648.1 reticulophagy regulator 3-like isoform X1 [Histomonas meleagridis]
MTEESNIPPEKQLYEQLLPYENAIMSIQSILLWKKPVIFCVLLVLINSLFIFAYCAQMGIVSFIALVSLICYVVYVLHSRFGLKNFLDFSNEKDNKQTYTFEEICNFIGKAKQVTKMIIDYLFGLPFPNGIIKILYVFTVWLTLAFVSSIIGKFWLCLILINVTLLGPGILNLIKNQESSNQDKQEETNPEKPHEENQQEM